MPKILLIFLILINIPLIYGKGVEIKVLLINNKWLEADLIKADQEGNLTIELNNTERILRRKEFLLVKMALPPAIRQVKKLFRQNKIKQAEGLLESIAAKYKFPPMQLKITVLQAQVKIAQSDYQAAITLLKPLLKDKIIMPQAEAIAYAHAFLLLGNAYADIKEHDNAVKAYRRSFELAVPQYSAMANLILGKMLLEQNDIQGALNCFLENIAVFSPEVPGRKFSLQEIIVIYKEQKSNKLKLYEDMLKQEYSSIK